MAVNCLGESQLTDLLHCAILDAEQNRINSSGQGVIPYRRYSPRTVRAAELVRFQYRQYSLDERR